MPVHPLKTALRHFLTIYQERKVFGMFWIYPLTVPYDIPTEIRVLPFSFCVLTVI